MAAATDAAAVLAEVPCHAGRRLHFEWGVGAELLLADVQAGTASATSPSTTTLLSWCAQCTHRCGVPCTCAHTNRGFAGPLRRRVVFDTLPKYTALKRDAIQGGQPLTDYCNTVEQLLEAAANAPCVLGTK